MTQPVEAVGGEAVDARADAIDTFEAIAAEMLPQDEEEEQPAEGEEGIEPDATEEADDEADIEEEADDLPPIDPPVSWDAEAKERFAKLPREDQEYLSKREGERERFVQQKSQEATRAKQDAIQQATSELAQIEQGYAQHFQQLAEQIAPQRPNPALLQHDPQAFYAQQAAFENAVAQQRELQQRATEYARQAEQRQAQLQQAEQAEQHRIIVEQFPEYVDPTSGPKLRAELSAVAKEIGYSDELIAQARAPDILAMRKVAEWRADSLKLKSINASKMAKVRAAKGLPKVATPGVAQGGDQLRAQRATTSFETAKNTRNRDVQGGAFYDFLKNSGHI